MRQHRDLTGKRFGRWIVLSHLGMRNGMRMWECQCDCGTRRAVSGTNMIGGLTQSCGCWNQEARLKRKKHGASASSEHRIWRGMTQRCGNPRNPGFKDYGGRGITICPRWIGPNGFASFLQDMGARPSPGHTIDRIDNDRNYCPENCRWATRAEQSLNRRCNYHIEYGGKRMTIAEWARELGTPQRKLYVRFHAGWPVQEILMGRTASQ